MPKEPAIDLGALAHIIEPLLDAAKGYTDLLVPVGVRFMELAIIIEAINLLFQYWTKGSMSDLVSNGVRLFIVASIPIALLASWPEIPNTILDFFQSYIPHLLGLGAHGSGVDAVSSAINKVFKGAFKVFSDADLNTPTGDAHWWQVSAVVVKFAILVILFIPLMILGLALCFALFGPMLLLMVGVIFGPILVPWIVFKPLSSLATKWFTYMVTMGMSFAVGIVLALIASEGLKSFAGVINAQKGWGMSLAALAGLEPLLIGILFIAYMLLKVEQIAAGMVGGPSIGGGAGFAAAAAMMATRMSGGKKGGDDKGGGDKGGGDKGAGGDSSGSSNGDQANLSQQAGATSSAPSQSGGSTSSASSGSEGGSGSSGGSGASASSDAATASSTGASETGGGATPASSTDAAGASSEAASQDAGSQTSDASSPDSADTSADAGNGSGAAGQSSTEGDKSSASGSPAEKGDSGSPAGKGADKSSGRVGSAGTPTDGTSATPSKGQRAKNIGKSMARGAWKGTKAVAGSNVGRAAAFSAAAMFGGPATALGVGAYAVSGKLRGGTASMMKKGGTSAVNAVRGMAKKATEGSEK